MENIKSHRIRLDDEETSQDDLPSVTDRVTMNAISEILWAEYAIRPNIPFKAKVEQLHVLWRLNATQIAEILSIPTQEVDGVLSVIYAEWQKLGKALDADEREQARGQMIAELTKLQYDIDEALTTSNDKPKLFSLKLTVLEQRGKLQGLGIEKRESTPPSEPSNPIEMAITNLDPEQQEELYNLLES